MSNPVRTNPHLGFQTPPPRPRVPMHVSINTISSHLSSNATLLLHLLTTPPSPLTNTQSPFDLSIMADRNTTHPRPTRPNNQTFNANSFLRKLQNHVPNSAQLVGFLTLLISGSILLFLTGLAVTVTVLGLIVFAPLLIVSSPIWVPIVTILFLSVAGFLSFCGFGVAVVAGLSWMYRYFRGLHPPGSDQFDYARSRIYDTASHVKDYAREYGGYLQSKVKDAAPGA